ncbi:COX15/CtaA family protein [bacterium]|nr:COX15/CtaA family protein [bacterium]NUN46391.1 COX15/CtaA family protein [bacterium]
MNRFRQFALFSTIATYVLIFVGGLVRVSGAGLGCPDWPQCFGHWFPPTSVDQIPSHIDPSLFNMTLAWIEYGNRVVGVTIGFLIAGTAWLAIKHYRHDKRILTASVAAAILVAFQGWQGSRVVKSQLNPHIISIHFALALLIISLMVYVTFRAYKPEQEIKNISDTVYRSVFGWIKIMWVVNLLQILLGTEVRGALEVLANAFPLMNEAELMRQSNYVSYIHGVVGVIIVGATWLFHEQIQRVRTQIPAYIVTISNIGLLLMITQLFIGVLLVTMDRPPLLQIVHLWISSFQIGLLVIFYAAWRRDNQSSERKTV